MEDFLEKGWWLYGEDKAIIQQTPEIESFLREILSQELPKLIIEIGTSFAGLTILISDTLKKLELDAKLISYDNAIRQWIPELALKYNFNVRQKTIGEESTNSEIIDLIKNTAGKVLILCDGGAKASEFSTFASSLKSGDIIGAHDYADNREDFEERLQGKIWNWMEIQHSDIERVIIEQDLQNLDNDLTVKGKQVAWIFKKK